MGTQMARDMKAMGPWVPILVVSIFFLIPGLDISMGRANDDVRFGYVFLTLFALTAAASYRWRRQPRAMALVCIVLIDLLIALGIFALTSSAIAFGLPVVVIATVILGALGWAALLFWRKSKEPSTA